MIRAKGAKQAYLHDWLTGITQLDCMWYSALDCTACFHSTHELCLGCVSYNCDTIQQYLHMSGTTFVAATRIIPIAIMRTKRICISLPKFEPTQMKLEGLKNRLACSSNYCQCMSQTLYSLEPVANLLQSPPNLQMNERMMFARPLQEAASASANRQHHDRGNAKQRCSFDEWVQSTRKPGTLLESAEGV